jgi:hypothetical protein
MHTYTLIRVSPGAVLKMPIESEHNLNSHQLVEKSLRMLREHYEDNGQPIIADFCHTFTNIDPKYGLLVFALDTGYGLGIVNYESFIVKPNK